MGRIEVFPMETHVKLFHFFVGGTRHETNKPTLTGTEIKALAGVVPTHQLFYRDDVNTPDRLVRDTQAVDLIAENVEDGTNDRSISDGEDIALGEVDDHGHFYAVANASYKRRKSNP
jgi:Multiubiquitin